jgi:23S rRNA (uracil1939-C5)-methyltransferase
LGQRDRDCAREPPLTAPGCVHAPQCPGCPLIAVPYAQGLEQKTALVRRALSRYPVLAPLQLGRVHAAERWVDYRVRAKLVCDAEGRLGLYAEGSHSVVDTPECRVLTPALAEAAQALRSLLPMDLPVRAVDLRQSDRGVLVCLVLETATEPDPAALELLKQRVLAVLPTAASVAVNLRPPGAIQLLGPRLIVLSGSGVEAHRLSPSAPFHYATHGAFVQVHTEQAANLHGRAAAALGSALGALGGKRILELYAGSGALALQLAALGAQVTAVDSFGPGLAHALAAAAAQGLTLETHVADADSALGALPKRDWDAVIVNPPRRGLSPAVRAALASLKPQVVVYISCNPETLLRDLACLRLLSLEPQSLDVFDLIPLTMAIESLVTLKGGALPAPRVLYEDAYALALDKLPFEPTAQQGETQHSLLERARETLGFPALTPVHRLDQGTSGVCWFAKRPQDLARLTTRLASGSKTYLALARGVSRDKGKIARPLVEGRASKAALTRYRRCEVVGGHSLLELHPEQGPKHQLRRHLAAIGHPILGDTRYGDERANRHFMHRHGLDRPFLHCAEISFENGIQVRSELAGDLAAVLESLKASATETSTARGREL